MDPDFSKDKRLIRLAFDRAARSYDSSAVLQREVGSRMAERLKYVKIAPSLILDAGSGTGKGAKELKRIFPKAGVIELDLSQSMLTHARAESSWWKRLLTTHMHICGDMESLPIRSASFEMVWSNLALQWCDDLNSALSEACRVLKPNGLFMFSTFGPDTLKELRSAFSGLDGYSHVNRFTDMHDIGDALMHSGFSTPVMDMECMTLTYDDVRGVMNDLKSIGAHNVTNSRPRGLFGKSAWTRVLEKYEGMRRDGRLPATFEVVYGHAWKAEAATRSDGAKIVKFDFPLKK